MANLRHMLSIFLISYISIININSCQAAVVQLNEDNWDLMLEGEWMVEFFAPWCPACRALGPIWDEFGTWSKDLNIKVGQVDVTDSPGLSGRFMVTALPTIYHVKDGIFRQYRGSRDRENFLSFIEDKKWEQVEEVPAWKSPGSYQMAVVAQFFKLSMVLRNVHSVLVKDYGLPEWGSYLIFALCTILTGALIGLLLVCVIDLLFPPKPRHAAAAMAKRIPDQEEDLLEKDSGDDAGESQDEEAGTESQQEEVSTDHCSGEGSQASQDETDNTKPAAAVRKRKTRRAD